MNKGHINDEQIQDILDTMARGAVQPLPPHLNACASCREIFEQYRALYAGLAADPGFSLPPAFADSLLQRMPASRPAFWTRPRVWMPLAAGAVTLVVAGVFMFIDVKPLGGQFVRMATAAAESFRPLPVQFQQLFAKINGYAGLFILGGLGLLSAAVFDRILQRHAFHRHR